MVKDIVASVRTGTKRRQNNKTGTTKIQPKQFQLNKPKTIR